MLPTLRHQAQTLSDFFTSVPGNLSFLGELGPAANGRGERCPKQIKVQLTGRAPRGRQELEYLQTRLPRSWVHCFLSGPVRG